MEPMIISSGNNGNMQIFQRNFSLRCPKCNIPSNMSAVSVPTYERLTTFRPFVIGITYRCDACNAPVFLRFAIKGYDRQMSRIDVSTDFEEVERPQETFEYQYLPKEVASDLREALTCYSNGCLNAFAAMCRRCLQTVFTNLGAAGKDKVLNQLRDLKEMASIDDETFDILKQVVIAGHDGSHPHLPKLSEQRAGILLELMKDVMYQLYVRAAKIREAMDSRREDIQTSVAEP